MHFSWKSRRRIPTILAPDFHVLSVHSSSRAPKMWKTVVGFNMRSVLSSSMARSIRWPWGLLILISISLPGEHGVGASAAPPPPGDACNSHASSAAGKIAVEILGGLLSGVIFVGALYRLAAEFAQPLRFFICHTGGINQEGKNFPERLYDEMTQSLKLKFFIEVFLDKMVLRDGLLFPPQILKELERTQVGIVLVTPDFFTRKWPMVELVYFVESSEQISDMRRVLPLFYRMTVRQVQDSLRDGVWEGEWRKMSTHGDHPLSVERCRHAVHELCKYKGVEYSGSDLDRGRDREYIREILKRVSKIVCEEIWKNIRARNLVNSSLRGHAPDGRKVETLSTVSTTPNPQNLHLLDEDYYESDYEDDNEDDRQITIALPGEYQLVDNEVGNRLAKRKPMKHVPRTNQSFPTDEVASAEYQLLKDRLFLCGLTEQTIKEDGNCQFRALSDQLYRAPDHHKYVRKVVVKQLKAYPEVYAKYVPIKYSEYVKNMAKDAEWGDHVTLQAASDYFGIRIYLITSLSSFFVEIVPAEQKTKREIYLSFWAQCHYNSVYPIYIYSNAYPQQQQQHKRRHWLEDFELNDPDHGCHL